MAKTRKVKQFVAKKNTTNSKKRRKILDKNTEILKSIKNELSINE